MREHDEHLERKLSHCSQKFKGQHEKDVIALGSELPTKAGFKLSQTDTQTGETETPSLSSACHGISVSVLSPECPSSFE